MVNDLGVSPTGDGAESSVLDELLLEVEELGGEAVGNTEDVRDFDTGRNLVDTAVDAFGDLHVVVNSAGVLRPGPLPEMTEEDWDLVVDISLKGAFNTTRWAAKYWVTKAAEGQQVQASVIHNTSPLGGVEERHMPDALSEAVEQMPAAGAFSIGLNHWAAKGGAAEFMLHSAHELGPYGIRSNVIVPSAFTRLATVFPGLPQLEIPEDGFHPMHPKNNAPLVAWLSTEDCSANGMVFVVNDGDIQVSRPWSGGPSISKEEGRWSVAELQQQMPSLIQQSS